MNCKHGLEETQCDDCHRLKPWNRSVFHARYGTTCHLCWTAVLIGELIVKWEGRYVHQECAKDLSISRQPRRRGVRKEV